MILRTASTTDWRASACNLSLRNTPGELPFFFGNGGPLVPFFPGAPFGSSQAGQAGGIKVSVGGCSS